MENNLKPMNLDGVDIILCDVSKWTRDQASKFMDDLKICLQRSGKNHPITVMAVDGFDQIKFLDEDQMLKLGWKKA